MRLLFIFLSLSAGFMACNKVDTISPETLTGAWVEVSARKDTPIFNLDRNGTSLPNTVLVNRGKQLNAGGYLGPKPGSGYYAYELQGNTILVVSMFSSSLQRTGYRIEQEGDKLIIENFFELGFNQPATANRTLVRL
ncbi:hypothetical protein [Spirosoma areae]